jgi:hypothetical protein
MAKYRLLKHRPSEFQALNSNGWGYTLTIEVWSWWGLSKKIVEKEVTVPYDTDADKFYEPKINVWQRK